jgi:RNA polymerase sigma-70 factor (ECF subfamily)
MNSNSGHFSEALAEAGGGAHALATQILGDPEAAADAVQDAIVKALQRPDAYDPARGAVRPWFLAVVRRGCLDLLRRRRQTVPEVDALPADTRSPEESVAALQDAATIQEALARLSAEQRAILILRDFNDLAYTEIAQVLDVPHGTVMSRLHRARLALRKEMTHDTI